jgi:hypothetical protein
LPQKVQTLTYGKIRIGLELFLRLARELFEQPAECNFSTDCWDYSRYTFWVLPAVSPTGQVPFHGDYGTPPRAARIEHIFSASAVYASHWVYVGVKG